MRFRRLALLTALAVSQRQAWAETVAFAFTGGTRSYLEVCGCADAQQGGLARRASLLADLRRSYDDRLVVVDVGGGTTKIAVCEAGEVVELTAIDVGARLVCFDAVHSRFACAP